MADFTITQIAPIDAQAGLQQNITVNQASDSLSDALSGAFQAPSSSSPGWAETVSSSGSDTSNATSPDWAQIFFWGTVIYFLLKRLS